MITIPRIARAALLLVAVLITLLASLLATPDQLVRLPALGNAAINTAPAIRIRLAAETEPTPEPRPAPQPAEPAPPQKPEPEPEPEPETLPEPIPEPTPERVAEAPSAPTEPAPVSASAEPTSQPQSQQVELNAGRSDTVDNYLTRLARHLSRFYDYPQRARRLGQEGMPVVVFRFRRDGSLLDHRLETGSGHRLLDDAALAMLEQAAPLPPVPPDMKGQSFRYALPVRFRLR